MRLSHDQVVLVTGASSGIGRAVAHVLAGRGCHLLVTGRDANRLAAVAEGVSGTPFVCDLADTQQTDDLADRLSDHPVPDIVVHNAGVGLAHQAVDTSESEVRHLLQVNLVAPMRLTRALLPAMRRRGSGRLVFVTSIAGRLGVADESAYAASKAALGVYAASLRAELAGSGVGVTTVVPGVVATEFFRRRGDGAPYTRRFPRPMPVATMADALVHAVEHERAEAVVPRWLRLPIAVNALAPGLYSRLAGRFG
ncbi:MAG: SDR family NAD(P)-dependent oxidoreductase [Nocardioidaceae bacterium]